MSDDFYRDWRTLTAEAREKFGCIRGTLYQSEENGNLVLFVSITVWPHKTAWEKWKKDLADHPLRKKYRKYRIAKPEVLIPIVNTLQK